MPEPVRLLEHRVPGKMRAEELQAVPGQDLVLAAPGAVDRHREPGELGGRKEIVHADRSQEGAERRLRTTQSVLDG